MKDELVCWQCGETLIELILPMSRREECSACGADQHVCKLCQFYDVTSAYDCTEDRAVEVADKESANFCDYFKPRPSAYKKKETGQAAAARAELAALFGDDLPDQESFSALDDKQAQAALAKAELDRLFGGEKD
jgi:hypothetical protein